MANASLDSVAAFEERANQVGISAEMLQYLRDADFTTFGKLGFAISHSPQAPDDTVFLDFVNDVWKGADS